MDWVQSGGEALQIRSKANRKQGKELVVSEVARVEEEQSKLKLCLKGTMIPYLVLQPSLAQRKGAFSIMYLQDQAEGNTSGDTISS